MLSENVNSAPLRDRDGALVENWYIACLSKELGQRKPIQRTIYDTPIALFRDQDGKPRALHDRCLHRHAELSEGQVSNGCLQCPYHGWKYDGSGRVLEIPSEGPDSSSKPKRYQLKHFECVEQDGCVWVWMGNGTPKTATPPFRFPHFGESGWRSYFMLTDFDNEVTHLAENFMDVPHTVFVHRGWFRNRTLKKTPITVESKSGSVLVTYHQPGDSIGFSERVLNPKREPIVHTDHFILPNLTRVDYHFGSKRSFIIISQCTPVTTLKCRVYTAIIYRIGFLSLPLEPFFRFYTRQVITQDVEIMQNQGRSFRRDFKTTFHGTDADVVHTGIERIRDWAARGDERAYSFEDRVERTIFI